MFPRIPGFLELWHSLQHCETSTRSFRRVFRHQLSPDFEPVSVRYSLCQSQASSCGQCRQQCVQCVAQRSDEHGGLIGSRWNLRHRLRFCVLQECHVLLSSLKRNSGQVLSSLSYGVVLQQVSGLLPWLLSLKHGSISMRNFFAC